MRLLSYIYAGKLHLSSRLSHFQAITDKKPLFEYDPHFLVPCVVDGLRALFCNDLFQSCRQVDKFGVVCPWVLPCVDPVSKVDDQEDGNANIGSKEAAGAPVLWPEDRETVDQRQNCEHDDCKPRSVRLDPVVIRLISIRDALSDARLAESEVNDRATDPGYEARSIREIDELGIYQH